ncbi:MAG: O-Methyltransferase [Myxococcaceae bacterium]|nr:O-Methyltransferase [Myxococcaceae bacterium]
MREDVPSLTAVYVTFMRALASRDPELSHACSDPYAEALLPRALLPLLHAAMRSPVLLDAARRATLGMCDHIALRTALIDAALEHALAEHASLPGCEPVEQVVLLGAGFDARAHRMHSLKQAVVFEVDHPATQKVKQRKAKLLPIAAREVRYAPCDFHRTRIEDALALAGFEPARRSVWIWEGVTMYLPASAVADSLQTMARLSAAQSLLIATYLTPNRVAGGALLGRWSSQLLGVISEPIRFTQSPDELADLLARTALDVLSDVAPNDAAPHFGVHVKRPTSLMTTERILVATKRKNQT